MGNIIAPAFRTGQSLSKWFKIYIPCVDSIILMTKQANARLLLGQDDLDGVGVVGALYGV